MTEENQTPLQNSDKVNPKLCSGDCEVIYTFTVTQHSPRQLKQ